MNRRKRTGPAKEFPYYKIQYWDDFSICWLYIHKTFTDPLKAENFVLTIGKKYRVAKYRIIEVMPGGEQTIKTSE